MSNAYKAGCVYKRIDWCTIVRYDPSVPPGSPGEYVVLHADQVPPLVPVTGPVRLSAAQPVRSGPKPAGRYRRL
jgi:hypothetical protein